MGTEFFLCGPKRLDLGLAIIVKLIPVVLSSHWIKSQVIRPPDHPWPTLAFKNVTWKTITRMHVSSLGGVKEKLSL